MLGLIGGVGGTITIASYGYWVTAKKWNGIGWLPMMRLDNAVGYIMTGIFVVCMLDHRLQPAAWREPHRGRQRAADLGTALDERYGEWARIWFLIGFLAVTISSLLGTWNGVSLLFYDWTRTVRMPHGREAEAELASGQVHAYESRVAEKSPRSASTWSG